MDKFIENAIELVFALSLPFGAIICAIVAGYNFAQFIF
jgi:hypothetical protein